MKRAASFRHTIGLLLVLSLPMGCSGEKPNSRQVMSPGPGPARRLGPAATPLEAFENYCLAADYEELLNSLALEPRARHQQFITWIERLAQAEWNLEDQLRHRFIADLEPCIPARSRIFPQPEQIDKHFGAGGLLVGSTREHADGSHELILFRGPASPAGHPEWNFKAVKEEHGWKIIPPAQYDRTVGLEQVKRLALAKEAVVAQFKDGKFNDRNEVLSALSRALRRGAAESGTPEEALEAYEAALLAGDLAGLQETLCASAGQKLLGMLERSRRYHEAHRAYYEALEVRFGSQREGEPYFKEYDGSKNLGMGIPQHQVATRVRYGDDEWEFKVVDNHQNGQGIWPREFALLVRREASAWKIGFPDEDVHFGAYAPYMMKQIEVAQTLTPQLLAGKYKTMTELWTARREMEKMQESPASTSNRGKP